MGGVLLFFWLLLISHLKDRFRERKGLGLGRNFEDEEQVTSISQSTVSLTWQSKGKLCAGI